jgi:hypothetical protein
MSDQFNTQPQPRTFAPSKEDVLQNLQYFFGAPVSPEKLKDYSEHHAVTHHFPDAYIGQNTKIRDTLNNLILNVCSPQDCSSSHCQCAFAHPLRLCNAQSPQTWQTSVGLPYFQIQGTVRSFTDQTAHIFHSCTELRLGLLLTQLLYSTKQVVEWDEVRFDVRLMRERSRRSNHHCVPYTHFTPIDTVPFASSQSVFRTRARRACRRRCVAVSAIAWFAVALL